MSLEDFLKWMEAREATLVVGQEDGHTVLRLRYPCGDEVVRGEIAVSEYDRSISVVPMRSVRLEEMMRNLDSLTLEPAWPTKST